jgi:hypothetical protein
MINGLECRFDSGEHWRCKWVLLQQPGPSEDAQAWTIAIEMGSSELTIWGGGSLPCQAFMRSEGFEYCITTLALRHKGSSDLIWRYPGFLIGLSDLSPVTENVTSGKVLIKISSVHTREHEHGLVSWNKPTD